MQICIVLHIGVHIGCTVEQETKYNKTNYSNYKHMDNSIKSIRQSETQPLVVCRIRARENNDSGPTKQDWHSSGLKTGYIMGTFMNTTSEQNSLHNVG